MPRLSAEKRPLLMMLICAAFVFATRPAMAQQVTVQQPVLRQFSAGTTVSVPDRGRAFVGGVSRAASGRITTGPFRSNSNTGLERENSSVSAHVWIHDFEEMDRQALEAAKRGSVVRRDRSPPLTGMSGHAWESLQGRATAVPNDVTSRSVRSVPRRNYPR